MNKELRVGWNGGCRSFGEGLAGAQVWKVVGK